MQTLKTRNPYLRAVCTHVAGLAVGLGLGLGIWHATHQDGSGNEGPGKEDENKSATRSSHRRDRSTQTRSGVDVLKAVAPYLFAERAAERTNHTQSFTYGEYLKSSYERLAKSADALAPADDVAAAAIALLEKQNSRAQGRTFTPEEAKELAELQPRLLHWFRQDPEAAIKYLYDGNRSFHIDMGSALYAAIHEKGLETATGWLKERDPRNSGQFSYVFANYVASQGDPAILRSLKDTLPPEHWNRIRGQAFSSWPFDKADELLAIARENNSPAGLAYLAMRNGQKGAEWLMKHMASEDMDPAFREALTNSPEYRQLLENSSHIPIEVRAETLAKNRTDGKDAEQLTLELGGRDVAKALDKASKDWRFAFRNGKVTFEEVYEAVVADLPGLAQASPDAIRLQVFKELAEENGPAAMQALAHTPEPDKWQVALKPTQWMFYNVDPQKFYDYLQAIPHNDPTLHQARFESWVWHSASNISLYSRDYVEWVKNMPEGIDREMAAIGILRSVTPNDKAMYAEVDSWVKDPAMRDRIKAPPPTR
ncbi:hypothetical protein OVA24_08145 [Luteolibacter sp. SL250]|uniref:hypothetical protein n=1 Tax=Luteolibacter sp. SL250 TaxID=2995170 RepID=UPI00226EC9E2|nr:hypothetical protein [Luteolibacter sp. SL250]WAC21355.1 hypothetical protein OVA24_08145 [Luteolibacter sp. SL250]